MVVVGNGGLNSKLVISAIWLVLSWKVTFADGASLCSRGKGL